MKKRAYFITQSIFNILLSIYSILVANTTIKTMIDSLKEAYSGFPQEFQDRIIGIYEKAGVKITILFAVVVIIINIFLLIFALNKTLLKHKGLVITFSILTFFFTDRLFVQLFGITSFIVILCCKRKNPEDFPDRTKKEMPKLDLKKSSLKDVLLGILLLVVYFSQFVWSKFLPDDLIIKLIIEVLFNIIMILFCIIVFYSQLKDNFKSFKNNLKPYMEFIFSRLGIAYLFLFIFSIISVLLAKKGTSINQETLESLPKYYLIPTAIIYAPIVEEVLFRGVFRKIIKNKVIFIIISSLVFGILHTFRESSLFNVIAMAIPYVWLGCYLSYIYVKTNNIFTNITTHAIINLIAVIFILLI